MPSIKIKLNSYKEAIINKRLVEVIDGIISSYPVTFVNLERFRKDVDTFDELFWLKDKEGKYILVNNKFASSFHLTPSQIEGKSENNFIPAYLINFSKALDEYINESSSIFIIEGFHFSGFPVGENYQTIKIPVPGSEGMVGAIIGIAQKTETIQTERISLSSVANIIKPFVKNFILISKSKLIEDVGQEFCDIFSLKISDIYGINFESVLPPPVANRIEDFINSSDTAKEIESENPVMPGKKLKLYLIKGYDRDHLIFVDTHDIIEESRHEINGNSYDIAAQNNPEPVFIYDKENLRFLQVNSAALKFYGYRKDEFLQLDLTDLYTPEDIQTLLEDSDDKLKEGVYSKPHRQKRKDGTTIFVEINKNSINYRDKNAFYNVVRDVTKKLLLEKESQNFKAAFNNTDNLFFITDREGFIKSANNVVTEVLGYSAKSLLDTALTALLIDDDRGKINNSVFHSVSKEKLIFNTLLKKAGNEFVNVKLISIPVCNYNREIDSYNIIFSVIKEKAKEIVKEVVKETPAEKNSYAKEDFLTSVPESKFLSGVFHDLLTPINVILGFVQELTENIEQPSPEQKEAIEIINQNKANLLSLMNLLIEFIQLEKNHFELKNDSVRIIDVIEDLKKDIEESKIEGEGVIAFGKISSSLEIKTDRQKLQRFLTLLVRMLFKITGEKKLYIYAQSLGDKNFTISFKDGYNTVSESFIEKLNLLFSDNNKTSKLGISAFILNLYNKLLSLMGGEFKSWVEKEKKEAAFVFPIDLKSKKTEIEITEEDKEPSNKGGYNRKGIGEKEEIKEDFEKESPAIIFPQNIDLTKLSCLYLEDQLDSQMLFLNQMKDLKEINLVVSFEQALPLLNTKHFDFIVIDINLQGDYNGLDVLKIIKDMPSCKDVPVIAVTAYLIAGDKERFIQSGFNDFVSKPLLREKIVNSLEKVLSVQA